MFCKTFSENSENVDKLSCVEVLVKLARSIWKHFPTAVRARNSKIGVKVRMDLGVLNYLRIFKLLAIFFPALIF